MYLRKEKSVTCTVMSLDELIWSFPLTQSSWNVEWATAPVAKAAMVKMAFFMMVHYMRRDVVMEQRAIVERGSCLSNMGPNQHLYMPKPYK